MQYTTSDIDRSQRKLERLFPQHWLMENEAMKSHVNGLLVSTIHIPNCPIRYDHYETMVFKTNGSGKVTDWHELYVCYTHDEVVGHENGKAFAQSYSESGTHASVSA